MDDIPYLMRGVVPVGTESSMLVSSSKYLNHPRLREWVAMILLRKNGPDFPAQAEMYELIGILNEIRDFGRIEALFTEERRTNAQLDDWFNEGFVSNYKLYDFKDYPADTVGGKYYRYLFDGGFEAQIVNPVEPSPMTHAAPNPMIFRKKIHQLRFAPHLKRVIESQPDFSGCRVKCCVGKL